MLCNWKFWNTCSLVVGKENYCQSDFIWYRVSFFFFGKNLNVVVFKWRFWNSCGEYIVKSCVFFFFLEMRGVFDWRFWDICFLIVRKN